ncbi:serine hydrolase domain-containing protein [Burkholderia sp. PAMC 26561]|uniref:serine hydrolase domain-containing protein n=1 Tax=Burkholderia sp. PAMC 26561 TaxID=1795043 RepID=UPI00076B169A|nr:serine hydrolase domain-containing protein [Burkholderia sp. PAMC 26561]AME27218.1 hypothetical protein AXG89_25305 [Burkholderia sp. PAMC 26561]AME27630.1 hypothetical protein AXG89_27380 [Burkholderia sp. PAMC 26561]
MKEDLFSNIEQYVQRVSADFEAVGVAVGIVRDDRLVFSTEYGLRDCESHLPMTRSTLVPIASNTKLFTSIAAGLLVEQGQLTYDDPIRDFVPQLRFSSRELDAAVTLRDMLSHRTGLEAADMIRHRSGLSSKALFEKVRYLKAIAPMRTIFNYNNILYEAVGYVIELLSGMEYSDFVRKKLLEPLHARLDFFLQRNAGKFKFRHSLCKGPDVRAPATGYARLIRQLRLRGANLQH